MKKLFIHFLAFLFTLSLSFLTLALLLNLTVGSGDKIKSWLKDADTINLAVENSLLVLNDSNPEQPDENIDEDNISDSEFAINLDAAALKDIGETIREPVGEKLLVPAANLVVTELYEWLNQSHYQPLLIKVDLSANNKELKTVFGELVNEYGAELPKCEGQRGGGSGDEEIFCLDETFNADRLTDEIFSELTTGEEPILGEQIIDNAAFGDENEDASKVEKIFKTIHSAFRILKSSMLWLFLAALTFLAVIMSVDKDRMNSLSIVSRHLVGAFAVPVIFSVLVFLFLPSDFTISLENVGPEGEAAISRVITPLIREVVFDINKTYLFLTVPLLLAGIAGTIFIHKQKVPREDKKEELVKK